MNITNIVPLSRLVSVLNSAISAKQNCLDRPLHQTAVKLHFPFTHGFGVLSLWWLSFTPFRHRNK